MNKGILENEKNKKIGLVKDYDKSQSVNSFIVNGTLAWLDKASRVGLINSLQIEKAAGRVDATLWFNNTAYSLNIDDALKIISVIELYAVDCFNATETHIKAINSLDDLNRVYNYNYTKGYPKRLRFELTPKREG